MLSIILLTFYWLLTSSEEGTSSYLKHSWIFYNLSYSRVFSNIPRLSYTTRYALSKLGIQVSRFWVGWTNNLNVYMKMLSPVLNLGFIHTHQLLNFTATTVCELDNFTDTAWIHYTNTNRLNIIYNISTYQKMSVTYE